MKALLYKDFCVLKKVLRLYLLFFVLYGLMAVFNEDSGFLSGVLLVMAGMLPLTALASDEQGNFGRFGQVLPVSLRAMVGEKYLLGLISMAAGGGVSLLLLMVIELLHGDGFTGEMLAAQLLTVGVLVLACGVLLAVMLPLGFWLGVEKARLAVAGGDAAPGLLAGGGKGPPCGGGRLRGADSAGGLRGGTGVPVFPAGKWVCPAAFCLGGPLRRGCSGGAAGNLLRRGLPAVRKKGVQLRG